MTTGNIVTSLFTGTNQRVLSLSILLIRFATGVILFMTGAGKVFGWFGGFGMATTLAFYDKMGMGGILAYLSIYTELVGGLLLMIGLFTRLVSIPVMINMFVATATMWPKGFIVGGAAFPFIVLISSVAIFLAGPMAYSFDAALFRLRNISRKGERVDAATP